MEIWNSPEANDLKSSGFAGHNIFTLHSSLYPRKKPSAPTISGTKGQPSAVPPAFVYYHTHLSPDNGGTPVPLSGAAPGRTKRHSLGRLSAGGRPSLQSANPLFSQSAHLCCPYLYHTPAKNASLKSRRKERAPEFTGSRGRRAVEAWAGDICRSEIRT